MNSASEQSQSKHDDEAYETLHVHRVYNEIASHFSSTRYKPWPIVEDFLNKLPNGAVGLDAGCGNGKYLSVNPNIFIIASDRSENLVKIASQHCWSSAVVADGLDLPHRNAIFDFAISIAVVHHLSTPQRRVQALEAILAALKPPEPSSQGEGGRALIFCWALEQKGSRRGWDEGDEQDIMVPWVMKQKNPSEGTSTETTFHRYYHLYRRGELERDILAAGGEVMESGYERDNWWAIAARSLHASIGRRSTEDENPS